MRAIASHSRMLLPWQNASTKFDQLLIMLMYIGHPHHWEVNGRRGDHTHHGIWTGVLETLEHYVEVQWKNFRVLS